MFKLKEGRAVLKIETHTLSFLLLLPTGPEKQLQIAISFTATNQILSFNLLAPPLNPTHTQKKSFDL